MKYYLYNNLQLRCEECGKHYWFTAGSKVDFIGCPECKEKQEKDDEKPRRIVKKNTKKV